MRLSSYAIETLTQKDISSKIFMPSHKNAPFTKDVRKAVRMCVESLCESEKSTDCVLPRNLSNISKWKEAYNVYYSKDTGTHVLIGHDSVGNEYTCILQATFTVIPGTSYNYDVRDTDETCIMINPTEFQDHLDTLDIIHESCADNIKNASYTNSIISKVLEILYVRGVLPWPIVPRNAYSRLFRNKKDLSYSLVEWNEKMEGRAIDLARKGWFESDQPRITSMLIQILVPILAVFARGGCLYHGNLVMENIVYNNVNNELFSVYVGDKLYNVPTHGILYRVIGWDNGYLSCNYTKNRIEFFADGFQTHNMASWKDVTTLVHSVHQFTSENKYPLFNDWLQPKEANVKDPCTRSIHSAVTFLLEHCL